MAPPYQTGKTVHVHAKTLQTQRGRTHGAGCVRPQFSTAKPLGERPYELDYNNNEQTWKLSASKVQLAKTSLDPDFFFIAVSVFI